MKKLLILILLCLNSLISPAQSDNKSPKDQTEINKEIARKFYEDLWFSNNTENYNKYVAEEYIVHDTGDRKNTREAGIQQKKIADFFHSQGNMRGTIDYQIAEGDLVATRWQWKFEPTSFLFRIMGGSNQIPVINVFRIRDGKIVEIWNHRHDIDTGQGNIPFVKGLGIGLLIALIPAFLAIRYKRKLNKQAHEKSD